ncbi:MAG: hypothetical protein GY941_14850 [Planctomycetes bacterium]|nr:hypothetical protein [Planctomycetota bacterium]
MGGRYSLGRKLQNDSRGAGEGKTLVVCGLGEGLGVELVGGIWHWQRPKAGLQQVGRPLIRG